MNYRFEYAITVYRRNMRIGKLNETYRAMIKAKGIFGYYQDLEHCSQEYCKEQLELQGDIIMHVLTKGEMADWLVRLQTKIHSGEVFRGGELQGRDIKEYFSTLSYDELYQWWQQYQC